MLIVDSQQVVIKAQIAAGGRGKGHFRSTGLKGGVHVIDLGKTERIKEIVDKMLGHHLVTEQTTAEGMKVESIMLAEAYDIIQEAYVSLTLDIKSKLPMFVTSPIGGMNIEQTLPTAMKFFPLPYDECLKNEQASEIAKSTGLCGNGLQEAQIIGQLQQMYKLFVENDLIQLEINPFASTTAGKIVCFDAKLTVDDNARFRQQALFEGHPEKAFNFVPLQGTIGCLVNGAGLAMATMDAIKLQGGQPANFLDIGGIASPESLTHAIDYVIQESNAKVLFVNIFGGIVRCDMIAKELLATRREVPIVIRMNGTKSKEAIELLENSEFLLESDFERAIQKVVQLAAPKATQQIQDLK